MKLLGLKGCEKNFSFSELKDGIHLFCDEYRVMIMEIKVIHSNNIEMAVVESEGMLITDVQSALDLMATVKYESGCSRLIISKEAVADAFFILSTGIAGEILQKFINYGVKLAIVGGYSKYTSKPLKDFMYESNSGRDIFFAASEAEAVEKLCRQ